MLQHSSGLETFRAFGLLLVGGAECPRTRLAWPLAFKGLEGNWDLPTLYGLGVYL